MTAAGPASEDAYRAPNSQPAPMIDPNETNSSPRKPTSRRSLRAAWPGARTVGCASSAVARLPLARMATRDLVGLAPMIPHLRSGYKSRTKRPSALRSVCRAGLRQIDIGGEHGRDCRALIVEGKTVDVTAR